MNSPTCNSIPATAVKVALILVMSQLFMVCSFLALHIPARHAIGNAEALVVAGSIVVFTPNVSEQQREDVINGTLLAQLAANKKDDREKSQLQWYKDYFNVLSHIGFTVSAFSPSQQVTNASFTMESVVLNIMKNSATPVSLGVAKAALEALGKLPSTDKLVDLFDNQSSGKTPSGNFQLLLCDQAANGDVGIGMGAFYFIANKYDPRFMWSQWSKGSVTLFAGKESIVLNEDVYAQVRDKIAKKLGDKLYTLVSEIKL